MGTNLDESCHQTSVAICIIISFLIQRIIRYEKALPHEKGQFWKIFLYFCVNELWLMERKDRKKEEENISSHNSNVVINFLYSIRAIKSM